LLLFAGCDLFNNEHPEIPGKLVYAAPDEKGNYQIFTSLTNGENRKKLTHFKNGGAYSPSWSPDGEKIVFGRSTPTTSPGYYITIMKADGSGKQQLEGIFEGRAVNVVGDHPKWSPDGNKVAFDRCLDCELGGGNSELFVYDFQTDAIIQLTDTPASDNNPVWNPVMNKIAFSSDRAELSSNTSDIYVLDLDNFKVQRLTNTNNSGRQQWYSNGKELLYWSENNLYKYDFELNTIKELTVNLVSNTGFRPLSISSNSRYILIISFNLNSSTDDFKLQILDIETGEVTESVTNSRFIGADLFSNSF
tara:strand:+ start:1106 stop:2020 length:915 start_codon:yes stop_codon:yes gene_type:complete